MEQDTALHKKSIIICCDGTGNQLDETYSNVVKIFSVIQRIPGKQVAYYDPGVGTLSYDKDLIPIRRRLKRGLALATGAGLEDNVSEAYSFLMENYEDGDKVFLFGFSRGAYTVRVLAGLIREMGLLRKGCQNLISYAWDSYRLCYQKNTANITREFRENFSREVKIHFMGIWDTVSSVGFFTGRRSYPNTWKNPGVFTVRHALAIDELRRFYRQNLFEKTESYQDVKQVWFAGAHSDVGGSYGLNESELAQNTLQWMIREASAAGLIFDGNKLSSVIPAVKTATISSPAYNGPVHKSLSGGWWLGEIWPKKNRETKKTRPPMGLPRFMFLGPMGNTLRPTVHHTVMQRINDPALNYAPKNFVGHKGYKAGEFDVEN
jgi:uncharacterized protein (DUF2235 family)